MGLRLRRETGPSRMTHDASRARCPELVDRDVLVACGHYPEAGIGHIVTRDGRIVWEEA